MNPKILIAILDDEPELCDAIAGCLKSKFPEARFISFKQPCSLFDTEEDITILILDYLMPCFNGLAVIRRLWDGGSNPHIILHSAFSDRLRLKGSGFLEIQRPDRHKLRLVGKPDFDSLTAEIQSILTEGNATTMKGETNGE